MLARVVPLFAIAACGSFSAAPSPDAGSPSADAGPSSDAGSSGSTGDGGTAADSGDACAQAFICDDFERLMVEGGSVPWMSGVESNGALTIAPGPNGRRLLSFLSMTDQAAEAKLTKRTTVTGPARVAFVIHYEIAQSTMGPTGSLTDLVSVKVSGSNTETRFYINQQGAPALSLNCDACADQDPELPAAALAAGRHELMVVTTFVGPGGGAVFAVDGKMTMLPLAYPPMPADADVFVQVGADFQGGRGGSVSMAYDDFVMMIDPVR
jgi:hypothetical protein